MSEHPCRETLQGFLLNGLPTSEMAATVVHLLGGCDHCRTEMLPLARAMFTPAAAPEPQLSVAEEASYDRAISAACAKALEHERLLRADREAGEKVTEEILRAGSQPELPALLQGPVTWGLCEALIEKSRALRHTDPEGMLHFAQLAQFAADRLDPEAYTGEQRADMQARSWAELANAYRVQEDLVQAEAAIERSLDRRAEGTGDPLLYARIAELNVSLLCSQRRFKDAFRMLDLAYAIHRRYSDAHQVGRVFILRGLYTGYAGNPGHAGTGTIVAIVTCQ